MAAKQQQQHMGSSRFMGLSQEYPSLATAASYSSATNKKWVLNSKNDVVELGGGGGDGSSFHHQENPPAPPHPPPHFLESAGAGFMGDGRLMRYNSAPSCLFSDLDQIARSLNETSNPVPAQLFAGADQQQLPPLPVIIDKRNHNHPSHLELKKKNGGPGPASSSRFSTAQSSVVSLGMDFDQADHTHCSNGFTGLLTGSSTTTTTTTNTNTNNLLKGSPSAGLARQSSSPASLLSRLEIEHGTGTTGSSEEDSPLIRSPIHDHDHDQPGGMASDCAFWDGNAGNVAAAVAAVQHAHHVAAAAQAALHHQHQHQQHQHQHQQHQHQQQQQPMHGVFLSNGNSTGENRKRMRDVEMDIVEAAALDHHNQQQQHTLTRHLSLPISSRSGGGLLTAENLLQDSVPCRLRAKRGCATHPRSIAERVRRTRISERMRRLQELVPNMDKQTNMSDMLDEAAEYMKFLQKKVEELEDCREKCQGLCKMSQSGGASTHLS